MCSTPTIDIEPMKQERLLTVKCAKSRPSEQTEGRLRADYQNRAPTHARMLAKSSMALGSKKQTTLPITEIRPYSTKLSSEIKNFVPKGTIHIIATISYLSTIVNYITKNINKNHFSEFIEPKKHRPDYSKRCVLALTYLSSPSPDKYFRHW